MITSKLCTQSDFRSAPIKAMLTGLSLPTDNYHRKFWEWAMIAQSLHERGLLEPERRGLGFAVGSEPLTSYFASQGAEIVASDLRSDDPRAQQWDETGQLASGLESCWKNYLVSRETFDEKVSFEFIDMTELPHNMGKFDFTWSSCALEHLGSIDKGFDFLWEQMKLLKPGGWAVHTTEYNVSSNDDTVEEDDFCVIFRRRDIEAFIGKLRDAGHFVEEVNWCLGDSPYDLMVTRPPYKDEVQLKLELYGYIATSILLLIRAGE